MLCIPNTDKQKSSIAFDLFINVNTFCASAEITHRFQTATPAIRQVLLQYLLPWLHNMELVDPNVNMESTNNQDFLEMPPKHYSDYMKPPLKGEGWGSPQATEMVLNNLLYMTAKVT